LNQLDICRGIAILAVLFIHVSGHFMTALHPPKSHAPPAWEWFALAIPNQNFQWAVPCFLMLSAFVNARSLARNPDIGGYARRRVLTALLPYLLWSGVYIALNFVFGHQHSLSLGHVAKMLLTGTAHFHLYFFVLVLEMYLLLPLLVPLFQRRPPFWLVAVLSVVLQGSIYLLNRYVLFQRFQPTILWDILPVALGLWLFSQWERWETIWKWGQWAAGMVTLAALAVYSPLAMAVLLHQPVNTALYQIGEWFFTAGMSFLMLALAFALGRDSITRLLGFLGAESLGIYVMHPLAIIALDLLGVNKYLGTAAGLVIYYAACLALPLIAAWAWRQGKAAVTG